MEDSNDRAYTPVNDKLGTRYYYCVATATLDGQSASVTSNTVKYTVISLEESVGEELWDGEGTEESPYLLKSEDDLKKIRKYVNEEGFGFSYVTFKMVNDIELSADFASIGGLKPGKTDVQMGANIWPFSGTFDGGDKQITYSYGATNSLFCYVREATVKNLNIYGEYIDNYGLVSGYNIDYGADGQYNVGTGGSAVPGCPDTITIDNVTIKSGTAISKSGFIGGGASGSNVIVIQNSKAEAGVKIGWDAKNQKSAENSKIGSFAGLFNGKITNCVSYADVYGVDAVGGLVGQKAQSMGLFHIVNCSFHGSVNASGDFAGGIVAKGYTSESAPNTPSASVENCYVTGKITASDYVGGIFGGEGGQLQAWDNGIGYVRNNCFVGTVAATGDGKAIGAICGYMRSINKYNIVENNYYLDDCGATKGIGGALIVDTSGVAGHPRWIGDVFYADTSTDDLEQIDQIFEAKLGLEAQYTYIASENHNREDDPLGADAEKLAKAMTKSAFADGTVAALLNESDSSLKNWEQSNLGYPVHSGMPIAEELMLSGDYKTEYYIGETLNLSGMIVEVKWSDGTTTTVDTDDIAVKGFDSSKRGTLVLTLEYGAAKEQIQVQILKKPQTNIKVTFSLLGDAIHDSDTDKNVRTLSANNLVVWLAPKEYEVDLNATVKDVLEQVLAQNGLSCSNPAGNYVESITKEGVTLAEFDNGLKSGWMYTLNGKHPILEVNEQYLEDGDVIVFHYTDDYTVEEGSEGYNPVVPNDPTIPDGDSGQKPSTPDENPKNPGGSAQTPSEPAKIKASAIKAKDMTYTGKKITPVFTTKDGVKLAKTEYKIVSIKNNKKIGKATVKVQFLGKNVEKKTRTLTFKIVPKSTSLKKLARGKKQITVIWKTQKKQTSGYQIQYSTSKTFTKKTTKSVTVKASKTKTTIKKLKAKKNYYVRIRTYKMVGKTKYYSSWSKVKSVKTK